MALNCEQGRKNKQNWESYKDGIWRRAQLAMDFKAAYEMLAGGQQNAKVELGFSGERKYVRNAKGSKCRIQMLNANFPDILRS